MMKYFILRPEKDEHLGPKWAYGVVMDPANYDQAQKCPVCGKFVSMLRWAPPYRIRLSSAKPEKWGDFVWGAGFELLVSAHFKNIYEAEGLRGIEKFSEPIEIVRIGKYNACNFPLPLPIYHSVLISWGGADRDDKASGYVRHFPGKECPYCRVGKGEWEQKRTVIDEKSWTGADLFIPRGMDSDIVVTEKFFRSADQYGFTNIGLIPAERFAQDSRLHYGSWYLNDLS
jgi:hypothetical protein